jgi:hypothetical protein
MDFTSATQMLTPDEAERLHHLIDPVARSLHDPTPDRAWWDMSVSGAPLGRVRVGLTFETAYGRMRRERSAVVRAWKSLNWPGVRVESVGVVAFGAELRLDERPRDVIERLMRSCLQDLRTRRSERQLVASYAEMFEAPVGTPGAVRRRLGI